MFRRASLMIALGTWALAALAAGCHQAKETPQPAASNNAKPAATAKKLRIAAAADLRFAFDALIPAFKKAHPDIEVTTTFGSSGNFFTQLSNKAPFDLFLSADTDYPRQLEEKGLAKPKSLFRYAIGHVVLWVPNGSKLVVEKDGMKSLEDPSVRKIAIANPKHAPYGRAAEAALKKSGVYDKIKEKIVLGDNVAQTAQFIESGAADVGLIAQSLALAPEMKKKGRHWLVPADLHPKLEQGGVIMSWCDSPEAGDAFVKFLVGDEGKKVLSQFGFEPAGN